MEIETGDIVYPEGRQFLLSSDQTSTYLCQSGDFGIVISICPESDQIELMISGEMMYAYSRQIRKFIDCSSDE